MVKLFLTLVLLLGAATIACGSDSTDSGNTESSDQANVESSGQSDVITLPEGGSDPNNIESGGEIKCPEVSNWGGEEDPEVAALDRVCDNTDKSLEFKDSYFEETGTDRGVVTILADEFGCSECPRELECVHEVFYKRQEKLWEVRGQAFDRCVLSTVSVEATATTERERIQRLVDSYQITIYSNQAERTYKGIEVPMSMTPPTLEDGVRLQMVVIYKGKEYLANNIFSDDTSDGELDFGFSEFSPDSGLGATSYAEIISIQVLWQDNRLGCGDSCEPDYYGQIFRP